MKEILNISLFLLLFLTMDSCQKGEIELLVKSPDNNHLNYIGADVSLLTRFEQNKAIYQDENGQKIHVLPFFKDNGFNYVRYRLFVNPNSNPDTCQDLEYVIELCKRSKAVGLKVLLDFHYSNTWADPGKQFIPDKWKGLTESELNRQIYNYTKTVLQNMQMAGVLPDMIQTGNEITSGLLWNIGKVSIWNDEWNTKVHWNSFSNLLKSTITACREVIGTNVKIIIHTDLSGNSVGAYNFYTKLKEYNVEYDIIGLSYYPFWHGTLAQVENTLKVLTQFSNKKIVFVETAYPYKDYGYPTSSIYPKEYPTTPNGQAQFVSQFINTLQKYPQVEGIFYWNAEETYSPNEIDPFDMHIGLFNNETGKVLPAFNVFRKLQK